MFIDFPHRCPDYALLSAWNHATEIHDGETDFFAAGRTLEPLRARGRNCCVIIK